VIATSRWFCRNSSTYWLFGVGQLCRESGYAVPKPINLSEIPQRLYPDIWAKIRAYAPSDISALTHLNAPYPDEDSPSDFFWGYSGSADEARRCYDLGREVLNQCRAALIQGRLRAFGLTSDGQREAIQAFAWGNLWPMFATNWASGPNNRFYDVQVIESDYKIQTSACIAWLRGLPSTVLSEKKSTLFEMAKAKLGATHRVFNEAYKAVLGRRRGRPRKAL